MLDLIISSYKLPINMSSYLQEYIQYPDNNFYTIFLPNANNFNVICQQIIQNIQTKLYIPPHLKTSLVYRRQAYKIISKEHLQKCSISLKKMRELVKKNWWVSWEKMRINSRDSELSHFCWFWTTLLLNSEASPFSLSTNSSKWSS